MQIRASALVLVAVPTFILLGIGAWRWSNSSDVRQGTGGTRSGSTVEGDKSIADNASQDPGVPSPRVGVGTVFRIEDERGESIESAQFSWSRLGAGDPSWALQWPFDDGREWRAHTILHSSDASGRLALDAPPGDVDAPSALWITHPGHAPWSMLLDRDDDLEQIPRLIVLASAPVLEVDVEGIDGRPVAGATVLQRFPLDARMRAQLGVRGVRLAYGLRRETLTDAQGRASLASLDRAQIVDATLGISRCIPWKGTAPDSVHLRWVSTFTWSGRVEAESPLLELANSRVEVRAIVGSRGTWLGVTEVRADGTFGPTSSPAPACDSLEFGLEGSTFVPTVVLHAPPNPAEHVQLVLVAKHGFRFPVTVTNRQGDPLVGAEVSWSWAVGETWKWAVHATDDTGTAVLPAAPAGGLWLLAEKSGYVGFKLAMEVWSDVSPTYPVVLDRGAVLRGKVTSAGLPVTDFSIVHRAALGYSDTTTVDFLNRKDGTYVIEGVPVGERSCFAVGEFLPRSSAQTIVLSPTVDSELSFDLRPGGVAQGVVRHALTGEPIENASIGLWVTEGRVRTRPFGARVGTDALGRFEVGGLAIGELSTIEVTHPGHASTLLLATGVAEGALDVGVIALAAEQSLRVVLRVPMDDDPTAWTATLWGRNIPVTLPFPRDGVVQFDGLSLLSYDVDVSRGIERADSKNILIRPDAPRDLVFDLTRGVSFLVEIDTGRESVDLGSCQLRIYSGSNGKDAGHVRGLPIPGDGIVRVAAIEGSPLELRVENQRSEALGSLRIRPELVQDRTVRLALDVENRAVRMVDPTGAPLQGLSVGVAPSGGGWRFTYTTDSDGLVRFPGSDETGADLHVFRAGGGGGVIRGVVLSTEPEEVTYAESGRIAIRLLDGSDPLAGVSVWLWDGFGLGVGFEPIATDLDGRAGRAGFMEQGFEAEIDQPGLWPRRQSIVASGSGVEQVVQVRRRGSVVLHAKRGGLALAGVVLRVESEEFATSVDPWIADGRVTASDARGATDDQGRLRLDGLPRGTYRWSITLDEGATIGGRFDVEPHRRVDVDVLVP